MDGDSAPDVPTQDGTTDGESVTEPEHARWRSSLLWGLVGGLAFLVLIQGYELLADDPATIGAKVGVAAAVAVGATAVTYAASGRLPNESA